jgi:hypothetical protein
MLSITYSIIEPMNRVRRKCVNLSLVVGFAFACAMLGCQPSSPESNNASVSGETPKKASGDGNSKGSEEPIKDNSKQADKSKNAASNNNAEYNKNTESPIADSAEEAKRLIAECVANYGSLKSYEDDAILHLSIPLESDPVLVNQPLRIAFERPNKLAMNARALRSMWTSQTFESIVGEGSTAIFDNQRVVRPLPDSINIDWLLEDHLFSVLPIPNVGSPLAIELLLASKPMEYFFAKGTFAMLSKEVFDNVSCERVEIIYNEGRFVLWVDPTRKLILRQELPIEIILAAFPPMPPEFDRTQIRFSVDLIAAKADSQIDWSKWSLPRKPTDLLVRRFVEPPFRGLPKLLGEVLAPVLLKNVEGVDVFDSAARKTPITLLSWIDNSNASRSHVDEIRALEREFSNLGLQSTCQIMLVSNLPADKMKVAMQAWNCDLPLALDTKSELQKQCGVSRPFANVVIGRDNRLHLISEVPDFRVLSNVVQLLKEGVDLAAREIQGAVHDEARYASRLHRNILNKEQIENMQQMHQEIAPFPMMNHDMERDWVLKLEQSLAAAGGELYLPHIAPDAMLAEDVFAKKDNAYRMMTGLDESGGVFTVDQSGEKSLISSIPIELATNAIRIHIRPDPWTHGWVAVVPEGLPRFWFFVAPVKTTATWTPTEAVQIKLEEGESIESSMWAMKDGLPILCLTTNKSRLRMFEPTTQKLTNSKLESNMVSMVGVIPQLDMDANSVGWSSLWSDSALAPLAGMSLKSETQQLLFRPEFGNWVWGVGRQGPNLVALRKLESGETGSIQLDRFYKPLFSTALSVRPEQCRLLSAATIDKNQFYWLAAAPNRVLHLQTRDGGPPDQMSFGERVFGATIVPHGLKLKLIVALEKEVSCWTLSPKSPR